MGGPGKVRAKREALLGGGDHLWVSVPKPDGPKTHAIFDEFIAIDIPHPAAVAARDETGCEDRILIVALRIGVAAARD